MAKGDGSLINRGRNVWEVQLDFGTNPVTGKRERVYRTVHGTKRDAAKVRDAIRREHESGLCVDGSKMTFKEFSEEWQRTRENSGEIANRTIQGQKGQVKRLNELIGGIRLSDITPHIVESMLIKLKSDAGKRSITVDALTMEHLMKWKRFQAQQFLKLGIKQQSDTYVCCGNTGNFINESNFEHWWLKWRMENGFTGVKFHELRHTQATQLFANGMDIKTVQNRLGHANASLTLNTYAHALPENDSEAAELIGKLFSQEPEKPRILKLKTA